MDAFKDGVTTINYTTMNELLALQDFTLIYEGIIDDYMVDSGTTENLVADYNYAIMMHTGTGITTINRIELDVAIDGTGQDLVIEIRDSAFKVDGSAEGNILKTVTIPKEFLPASQAFVKIPINLTGLTALTEYWLIVKNAGDATNHTHIYSKGSLKNAAHACYKRVGDSGAWTTLSDSIRFSCFQGNSGDLIHAIYGTNMVETYIYTGEDLTSVYRYLPPSDGAAGGIRDIIDLTFDGDYLTEGAVT